MMGIFAHPEQRRYSQMASLFLLVGLVHRTNAFVLSDHPTHTLVLTSHNHNTTGNVDHYHDTSANTNTERSFNPTDQDRALATDAIMRNMTDASALDILKKDQRTPPALIASVQTLLASARSQGSLRASSVQPDVGSTKKMLNDMLYQSLKKYDLEQAKCSNYYATKCAERDSLDSEISRESAAGAACKSKTLSAQAGLGLAQPKPPKVELLLKFHEADCEKEINATETHLKRVKNDIAVMTTILTMTDCSKKALVQTKKLGLLHCKTECAAKTFVSLEDPDLRAKLNELESAGAHQAFQEMFSDLAGTGGKGPIIELLEDGQPSKGKTSQGKKKPLKIKKTKPMRKPAPRTQKPADPCDPNAAMPNPSSKRAGKCTVGGAPNCPKMNNRFLFIQAGMMDERDALKDQLTDIEERCKVNKNQLNIQIEQAEASIKDEQIKLAEATGCENGATERGRTVSAQHSELVKDMANMQKSCGANYQALLSEQCGLRKIRGDVLKLSGVDANLQDCKLGPWAPQGKCSKKCGGGTLVLERPVMMSDNGGASCLPLQQNRSCNESPCPIDCKVATQYDFKQKRKVKAWGKWSTCSAPCGGGVAQRAVDVITHMRYGGKSCGQTSQSKTCNVHACDQDCTLSEWTKWSGCSKQCDGGTIRRARLEKVAATGDGKCAIDSHPTRLQYKTCNVKACKKLVRKQFPTLQCESKLDVILLLDGSTDLGAKGWAKTVEAAKLFVSSFQSNKNARVSVLTFSGPTSWGGVSKCMGESKDQGPVDMEKDCLISWTSRFTSDMQKVTSTLDNLQWPKGGSLTSLALAAAENELQLARKNAKSVVVVITRGRPLSFRRAGAASERIKKSARLVWVPVSKFAPLEKFKMWASQRWQENVVQASSYSQLATATMIDHLIADICPEVDGGVPSAAKLAKAQVKKVKKAVKKKKR